MTNARAVLLDVEGTTTAIDFVAGTLFPIARRELPAFAAAHEHDPSLAEDWAAVRRATATRIGLREERISLRHMVETLLGWMDEDRKETALKSIQGRIWERAYGSGALRSHVYPDVAPALRRWRAAGIEAHVYSSGSALAQELLFRHTIEGDLRPLLGRLFDTTVGGKREAESYRRIAAALAVAPAGIVFLSDSVAELDAAREAGLRTTRIVRAGTAVDPESDHAMAATFDEVLLD